MNTKAEGLEQTRGDTARKRSVSVRLSQVAFDALVGDGSGDPAAALGRTESAMRLYLSDKGAGRPAWAYPGFLRQSQTREDVGLEFEPATDLWLQFEAEAEKQDVSPQQLLEHAVFYFAAELDAGRLTQRILDDLEAKEAKSKESS